MATATDALNRDFLDIRCRLLDLAAALDRVQRAGPEAEHDPRMDQIRQSLEILASAEGARAQRVQMAFSLPYDENWQKKT